MVDSARYFPVIGILGPRQSGKTTLAKELFENHVYLWFFKKSVINVIKKRIMLKKAVLKTLLIVGIFIVNSINAIGSELSVPGTAIEIDEFNLLVPSALGNISLIHNEDGFSIVEKDGSYKSIQNCFIDREIRNRSTEQLQRLLGNIRDIEVDGQRIVMHRVSAEQVDQLIQDNAGSLTVIDSSRLIQYPSFSSYIQVIQMSDGEYALHLKTRLLGGGYGGWVVGAWAGKFLASALCHGGIFIVAAGATAVGGPAAGYIVATSLESTLAVPIETFTTAAAVAAGIAGGVAIGSV